MYNINSHIYTYFKKIKQNVNPDRNYILNLWEELVGESLSKNAKATYLKDGSVLCVQVKSSSWLNEIKFMKEDIIGKYNQKLGREIITDILFTVKKENYKKEEQINQIKPQNNSQEVEIINKEISIQEKGFIYDSTNDIDDTEIKDSLRKFFEATRGRELAMMEKGWKKCLNCKALHKEENSLLCKLCKSLVQG